MTKRKGIPTQIRFEIFKRDSFTCQYCGRKAPDVILEIDHIHPVAKGGDNDIMNLVTACETCNAGKTDKVISDNSTITKQRTQIELLQVRREQLDMMLTWRDELSELNNYEINRVVDVLDTYIEPFTVRRETFVPKLKEYKKKWGTDAILSAADVASKYLECGRDGKITQESANKFLDKIPGICYNVEKYEKRPDAKIIDSIRYQDLYTFYINPKVFFALVDQAKRAGFSPQDIKDISVGSKSWSDWRDRIENAIDSKEITNG